MSGNYSIQIHHYQNLALLAELIDEFIPPTNYVLLSEDDIPSEDTLHYNLSGSSDKDEIKREMFDDLHMRTGVRPDWGILTGVRPVKLAGEMLENIGCADKVFQILTGDYRLTEEKARLILDVYLLQKERFGMADEDTVGLYVGIPFCPTRCVYCSFASNQVPYAEIQRYLPALYHEIRTGGKRLTETGQKPESIYIGGGTPTTLEAADLGDMIRVIRESFDFSGLKEFTVEAGRPDTITPEKLDVLKELSVDRISINPQSMKQETLDAIGRSHSPDDIRRAFALACDRDFSVINADLIAGLPGEETEDFIQTLEEVLSLGASNITIHTLAVKRASRLKDIDRSYHYRVADTVGQMLREARKILSQKGFYPYYLYRQKHMAGFYENTGYSFPGKENLYNVRIMDEHQTIVALGAGGISKRYYPEINRLERVPNVSNYNEYINRIDEMLLRKENKLWR